MLTTSHAAINQRISFLSADCEKPFAEGVCNGVAGTAEKNTAVPITAKGDAYYVQKRKYCSRIRKHWYIL